MLIDTHCHLDAVEFDGDRDAVAQAAQDTGVDRIIVPAVEKGNFAAVRDCCRRYCGCFPAYGIHPLYLERAVEDDLLFLKEWAIHELAGSNPLVAIGEIGLDFFVSGHDAALQEEFFVAQLKLARDLDLPVLLHVRRAVDQVLKCLRRVRVKGGIAHAFNGSIQQAEEFIRLGFKLGFGGAMTYPGSTRIRRLAYALPLEAIVLESDAPDMPPVWLSGGRNSPTQLVPIAQALADLRNLPLNQIIQSSSINVRQVIPALL
ncbi:MAG: TatD family hydrolase [Betaproteobacteria bacterium]